MRAHPPVTRVQGGRLTVRTALTAADGTELPPLEVGLAVAHADLLDPTATPALPVLASLAAARGEDLVVEGSVEATRARGAAGIATVQSGWWETGPVRVEVEATHDAPYRPTGVGLFFSRGVDSWSTLLDLLDAPPADRVTHLLAVHHGDLDHQPLEAAVFAGHQRVADELGLPLIVLSTSARTLLDPFRPWVEVFAPALCSAGLVAAAGLGRLVLASSMTAGFVHRTADAVEVMTALGPGVTEVVAGNLHRLRHERVAHVHGDPLARATLQICWEGETEGNCGRCRKCQHTMAALLLAGEEPPLAGFDGLPDPDRVRGFDLPPYLAEMVEPLIAGLPPEHEVLRRAWSDAWDRSRDVPPPPRWGDDDLPGLAGPATAQRVATALRATTGSPHAGAPAPLGWRPGAVPLRPALADHHAVRALAAAAPDRPQPWAVVEHHVRAGRQDGQQAALALACHDAFGPGPVYLPGILWAPSAPPTLDPDAVATLLRTARARLWWRPDGDLDPLRLVETIEQGCLPLQVMPGGPARELADALPAALAPLVVAEDHLAAVDLPPAGVAALLGPAVDLLLAGSSEHGIHAGAFGA